MTQKKIYRPERERPGDLPVVKWLRQQGERGIDYNFSGAGRTLSVWFMNDKIEVAYIMTWEWTK
jgi:hypothetical protein